MHVEYRTHVGMREQEFRIGHGLGIRQRNLAGAALLVLRLPANGIVAVEIIAEFARSADHIDAIKVFDQSFGVDIVEHAFSLVRLAARHDTGIFG